MTESDRLAALQVENNRLVALLDSHAIQWRKLAVPRSSGSEAESTQLSPEEKVALFRGLFRGRVDVYPVRWESKASGKSGYAPACGNEWQATLNPAAGAAIDYLTWSGDGTTLYGTSRQLPGLFTLPISAQGIASFSASGTFASSNASGFTYAPHWSGGYVHLDSGQVIDPTSGNSTILIPAQNGPIAMAPDAAGGLLFATSTPQGPQTTLSVLTMPGYIPVTSYLLTGQIEFQGAGAEPTMLLLRGATLAAPILVIRADTYLAFISGPVTGQ